MVRIVVVIGTRPEAIKMLPLVRALRAEPGFCCRLVTTGQHREMLSQVLDLFAISPDHELDLMSPGQSLTEITCRILTAMATLLEQERPDLVLVHGDTTTAMASAVSAFYQKIPIGHVEAGLRSHDPERPWPEEFNRVAVDSIATLLFAPTRMAAENLQRESPRSRLITVTGNTGIDALLFVAKRVSDDVLAPLDLALRHDHRLLLVTGHRRESFGLGFERICDAISRIADDNEVDVVYPVHLNPAVRNVVLSRLSTRSNIHLIEPVRYDQMVALMKRAHVILTDSGGIQEEGPALGKPVLVMRDVTERPEAVATGVVSLVGTDPDLIVSEMSRLLNDRSYYDSRARAVFPYGDGTASQQITRELLKLFKLFKDSPPNAA